MGLFTCILLSLLTTVVAWFFIPSIKANSILVLLGISLLAGIVGSYLVKLLGLAAIHEFNIISMAISLGLVLLNLTIFYIYRKLKQRIRLDEHERIMTQM